MLHSVSLRALALGALALGSLAACDNATGPTEGGFVAVQLTNGPSRIFHPYEPAGLDFMASGLAAIPSDEFAEANVTVTRVELIREDSSKAVVLSDSSRAFDLLRLRDGVTAALAGMDVPEGVYRQLRLVVAEGATVVMKDGATERLKIPSGTQTGIKVLLPRFEVRADDDTVRVTVDFDVNRSFTKAGNSGKWMFKPVLKPALFIVNGDTLAAG